MNDDTAHGQAPPTAGGYGVMWCYGDGRNWNWRWGCQRGSMGSATAARAGGLGSAATRPDGLGATATDVGATATPSTSLYSIPSLLTG